MSKTLAWKFTSKRPVIFFAAFLSLFLADQSFKNRAFNSGRALINPGISLGWLGNTNELLLLALVSMLIILGAVFVSKASPRFPEIFALALVLAGALSNFLDRLLYPGVIDYLYLPILGLHNNLADWGLFVGAAILAAFCFKDPVALTDNFPSSSLPS